MSTIIIIKVLLNISFSFLLIIVSQLAQKQSNIKYKYEHLICMSKWIENIH